MAVTCSDDRVLRQWDLTRLSASSSSSSSAVREYCGHGSFVNACDLDPTAQFLASVRAAAPLCLSPASARRDRQGWAKR
jgi:hypothetical protein